MSPGPHGFEADVVAPYSTPRYRCVAGAPGNEGRCAPSRSRGAKGAPRVKSRGSVRYDRAVLLRFALAVGLSSLAASGCVPDVWKYPSPADAASADSADASKSDAPAPDGDDAEARSPTLCKGPCDVPCAQGIVALYRAEGDARDAAGDQHAIARRGVTYVPGRYGTAFNIDGSPDYVRIPSPLGDLEEEFTISLWIKTGYPGRYFVRRAACWAVPGFRGLDMGVDADGHFNVEVFLNGTATFFTLESPANAFDDHWHHVAMVRRGTTLSLYVDGQSAGPHRFEADFLDPYSTPVYLGVSSCVAGAPSGNGTFDDRPWFRGAIDEVAFYRRALTDEELGDIAAGRCAP